MYTAAGSVCNAGSASAVSRAGGPRSCRPLVKAAHEGQNGRDSAETVEESASQGHGYAYQRDIPQVRRFRFLPLSGVILSRGISPLEWG